MLKIRLMGTKKDIQWFGRLLQGSNEVKINEFSEVFINKGTNNYFRAYLEIEKRKTDTE